jgi:hypothetical protein
MTRASFLRNPDPNLEFFRLRLAPHGLKKPTLRSFDRFDEHAV